MCRVIHVVLISINTSIFDKVPRTFTWLAYWRHGVTRDCKWSTMTLQVVSLIRLSSRKQHGAENNRSWLSTCSQVIRPWHLKVQHGKPWYTFKKLDVFFPRLTAFKQKELSLFSDILLLFWNGYHGNKNITAVFQMCQTIHPAKFRFVFGLQTKIF